MSDDLRLSPNSGLTHLVTTKPDAELAADFKNRLIETAEPLLKLFDEIDGAGFQSSMNFGKGPLSKFVIGSLTIAKTY